MRRGKKSVVRVAQRVAHLVPVQGLPSIFSKDKQEKEEITDEGLWYRPKRQSKNVGCVEVIVFLQ